MSVGYNPKIVTRGLIGYWDVNNIRSYVGSGTALNDISNNSQNAVLSGSPTFDTSNSKFLTFDGSTQYATVTGSNTVTEATFIMWMKRNGTQGAYTGLIYSRSSVTSGFSFDINGINLGYTWNSVPATYNFNSGLVPPDGSWCMGALSVNPTSATIYLGTSSGIAAASNTTTNASQTLDALNICQDSSFYGGFGQRRFKGSMALAKLYNRALSASEIQQNFNAIRGRFGI